MCIAKRCLYCFELKSKPDYYEKNAFLKHFYNVHFQNPQPLTIRLSVEKLICGSSLAQYTRYNFTPQSLVKRQVMIYQIISLIVLRSCLHSCCTSNVDKTVVYSYSDK